MFDVVIEFEFQPLPFMCMSFNDYLQFCLSTQKKKITQYFKSFFFFFLPAFPSIPFNQTYVNVVIVAGVTITHNSHTKFTLSP